MYFFTYRLSLEQLLQAIEDDDDVHEGHAQLDIFPIPPVDGNITDFHEYLGDYVGDLNCLGPKC